MKAALYLAILTGPLLMADTANGLWDAIVVVNGVEIPFRVELRTKGTTAQGLFFNGDEKVVSTSGSYRDGSLSLRWEHYAAKLDATLKDGKLEGTYVRPARLYPFRAKRFEPSPLTKAEVPSIAGYWEVPTNSSKGESAWRFIVRQSGSEVSAAILRVDGDTGTLSGTYKDGTFVLSHFSGARPALLEVTPAANGTLELVQNRKNKFVAVRSAEARVKGLPEPTDPSRHTSVKDPSEPFRFRFPDLNGRVVSESDPRFQGKVVIVSVGGSWCPNCHDEAPFLAELYRKYRAKGLEVVGLSFEEPEQLSDPTGLRAFIKQYRIDYPVLLCGIPDDVKEKLPQAMNLNTWPATFFLGRDGRVRSVHAGFASAATGDLHRRLKEEVTSLVERLLTEPAPGSRD